MAFVKQHISRLSNELADENLDIIDEFPIRFYLNDIRSYHYSKGFSYLSQALKGVFHEINTEYGQHAMALYHKLATAYFIEDSTNELKKGFLPDSMVSLFREWTKNVMDDFLSRPDDHYDHNNEDFMKDLAVCAQRAFYIGGPTIIEKARIIRRFLFLGGIS